MDEENQTSSSKQQEEPERTGHPPPASAQGVRHHLPLHPQHDVARLDANVMSSEGKSKKAGNGKRTGRERQIKPWEQKEPVFHLSTVYQCCKSDGAVLESTLIKL